MADGRRTGKKIYEKERGLVPSRREGIQDEAYNVYLESLDPEHREDVRIALASSPDQRFRTFLARIGPNGMKAFGRPISLAANAKACGIDLMEFNEWWQKASTQKAIAIAQTLSPKILNDMGEDAKSKWVGCTRCDGLGFVSADEGLPMETEGYRILRFIEVTKKDEDGNESVDQKPVYIRTCPAGCVRGKVLKPGDEFSREKTLEVAGLVNRKGAGVSLTLNLGGQAMPSAVERLNSAMTIDVEPE